MDIVTRAEAISRGLSRYFTGKPCKHGHVCERYSPGGKCIKCNEERAKSGYHKEWTEKNAEHVRKYHAERYEENKEAVKERSRKWRLDNPERMNEQWLIWKSSNKERLAESREQWIKNNQEKNKAYHVKWEKNNPDMVRAKDHRHRARKRGAEGSYTPEDVKSIYKMQKGRCAYCGHKLNNKYEIDHIIALANGGTNYRNNIQLLCPKKANSCNQSKGAKDPIDFAQSRGLLL